MKIKILLLSIIFLVAIKTNAQQNIIGGQPFSIEDAPYQVSLTDLSNRHSCGGIILSNKWILTAGHCLDGKMPAAIRINVGSTDNSLVNANNSFLTSNYIIHPKYSYPLLAVPNFDIALIELDSLLEFNYKIQPIEYSNLSNGDSLNILSGNLALLTGWGDTNSNVGTQMTNLLKGIEIPIITQSLSENIHMMRGYPNTFLD